MNAFIAAVLFLLTPLCCLAQDAGRAPHTRSTQSVWRFAAASEAPRLMPGRFLFQRIAISNGEGVFTNDESGSMPPLNAWRISGELLAGTGLGLSAGYLIGLIGIAGGKGFNNSIERGVWGLALGHTVGSAVGVYLIGTLGDETGSFAQTLLGSSLGMGTAFLVNKFVVENGVLFLALAPIGATLAFNLSRRYDQAAGVSMTLSLNKQRRMRFFVAGHQVPFY